MESLKIVKLGGNKVGQEKNIHKYAGRNIGD
jgi:hypothetical protein